MARFQTSSPSPTYLADLGPIRCDTAVQVLLDGYSHRQPRAIKSWRRSSIVVGSTCKRCELTEVRMVESSFMFIIRSIDPRESHAMHRSVVVLRGA